MANNNKAHIEKRGNSYRFTVSCGYTDGGKQVKRCKTWKPEPEWSKKRVESELQRQAILFAESVNGGEVTSTVKFETFATTFIDTMEQRNKIKPGTADNYRQYADVLFKHIGHMRLDKIKPHHMQQIVDDMDSGQRYDRYRKGKLAPKTIRNYIGFGSKVFNYARKKGIVNHNPCSADLLDLPEDTATEREIYTVEEMQEILQLLCQSPKDDFKYIMFYILAVYTGFRRGEVLGFEWKDIDWDRQIISLRRTSLYSAERGIYTSTPKTRTSYRSLKLPKKIFEILKNYRQYQDEYIENMGSHWETQIKGLNGELVENDRLFTQWDGIPMSPNTPETFYKRLFAKSGVKYLSVHSLRHFNATMKIFAGVDPKTVSSDLGHANLTTTVNISNGHSRESTATKRFIYKSPSCYKR